MAVSPGAGKGTLVTSCTVGPVPCAILGQQGEAFVFCRLRRPVDGDAIGLLFLLRGISLPSYGRNYRTSNPNHKGDTAIYCHACRRSRHDH